MKCTLFPFQLLVTCTHIELLLIHAIRVVPEGWVFYHMMSPTSYTPRARTAPSRICIECCQRYGGMLKIGLQSSRSINSPLQIVWYITGSRVSHRASLLLLLLSWFLSPFLFPTIMSLNRNNQQSGWKIYLVEYSSGYRQSLMWRMASHHVCGIW